MNLIEIYVYEVTKRLPEKIRKDIAMELTSTIEDMLPEHYSEEDVKEALSKLGNPAVLADSYHGKPKYLIGPKVYDVYIRTMKMVIPWAIFITLLIHTIGSIVTFSGEESILSVAIHTFGFLIAKVITTLIQVFFWFTIVFVAIERIGLSKVEQPLSVKKENWTPDDLNKVVIIPRKKVISKGEIIFSFLWTVIWGIIYFNADHLAGVYQSIDGRGLQFVMPVFQQDTLLSYWPIIAGIMVLEIGLAIYKWTAAQWNMKLATVNTIIRVLSAITFIFIASDPQLIHPSFISYLSNTVNADSPTLASVIHWVWRAIVLGCVVSIIVEVFNSYRKAKISSR